MQTTEQDQEACPGCGFNGAFPGDVCRACKARGFTPDPSDADAEADDRDADADADADTAPPTPVPTPAPEATPQDDTETQDDADAEAQDAEADADTTAPEDDADAEESAEAFLGAEADRSARFAGWLDALGAVGDKAKARIDPAGIQAKGVDAAHVAMFEATLRPDAWETYTVKAGTVGLDVEEASDAMTGCRVKDGIRVGYAEDAGPHGGAWTVKHNGMKRTIAELDPAGMTEPKDPGLDLPARVRVDPEAWYNAVRQADKVADCAELTVSEDGTLRLKAEGEVNRVSWESDGDGTTPEAVRSLYSLDYLKAIARALKGQAKSKRPAPSFTLELGTDYPARFRAEGDDMTVSYLLAPRIESD